MEEKYKLIYENIAKYFNIFIKNDKNYRENKKITSDRNPNYISFCESLLDTFCNRKSDIITTDKLNENAYKIYRGIYDMKKKDYIKCLKDKSFEFFRWGIIGYGNYYSADIKTALRYTEQNMNSAQHPENVISATIDKNSIVDIFEVKQDIQNFKNMLKEENDLDKDVVDFINTFTDSKHVWTQVILFSVFAKSNNYNAIGANYSYILSNTLKPDKQYKRETKQTKNNYDRICVIDPKALTILDK